ncbi:hypothetical protein D3C81_1057560 [compost metagenome]
MNKEELEEFKKLYLNTEKVIEYCTDCKEYIASEIYSNFDEEDILELGKDLVTPSSDKRDSIDMMNKIESTIVPILKEKRRFRYDFIPAQVMIDIIYNLGKEISSSVENVYIGIEYMDEKIVNKYIVIANTLERASRIIRKENSNIGLTDVKLLIDNIEENKVGTIK